MRTISNDNKDNSRKERKLTEKQFEILQLAYRFRFLTTTGLAVYVGQSQTNAAFKRLSVLYRRGFLSRRFDASYRLRNRPAEYYLAAKAIPLLRARLTHPNERELKLIYGRSKSSLQIVDRSLAIFNICLELRRLYGQKLSFATDTQFNTFRFNFLPDPLPDALATFDSKTDRKRHLFVDYFDDGASIEVHGRKLANYMEYQADGDWDGTELAFPTILIVCQSPTLLRRTAKRIRQLERQADSEISFRLIDLASLEELNSLSKAVWLDPIRQNLTAL